MDFGVSVLDAALSCDERGKSFLFRCALSLMRNGAILTKQEMRTSGFVYRAVIRRRWCASCGIVRQGRGYRLSRKRAVGRVGVRCTPADGDSVTGRK